MKTIEEMVAVMTAYNEGKQIEYRPSPDDCDWEYCQEPQWNWAIFDYRIKPEEQKPTYRPYESVGEILEDMQLHGPMVEDPTCNGVCFVSISTIPIVPHTIILNNGVNTTPSIMIEKGMTWQDGTPFGRRVEE